MAEGEIFAAAQLPWYATRVLGSSAAHGRLGCVVDTPLIPGRQLSICRMDRTGRPVAALYKSPCSYGHLDAQSAVAAAAAAIVLLVAVVSATGAAANAAAAVGVAAAGARTRPEPSPPAGAAG